MALFHHTDYSRSSSSTMTRYPRSKAISQTVQIVASTTEQCRDARSNNSEVQDLICRTRSIGSVFCEVIKDSMICAEQGYNVSSDMITLYKAAKLNKSSVEDMKELVVTMRDRFRTIATAHGSVARHFQDIQHMLDGITNQVPAVVHNIQDLETRTRQKQHTGEKRVHVAKFIRSGGTAGVTVTAVVAGLASVAFPPSLLAVPVLLSLVILSAEIFHWNGMKKLKKWEAGLFDCTKAQDDLRDLVNRLAKFKEGADLLSRHWTEMEVSLDVILGRLDELRDKSGPQILLWITSVAEWKELKKKFESYWMNLAVEMHVRWISHLAGRLSSLRAEEENIGQRIWKVLYCRCNFFNTWKASLCMLIL
ncbi:hypothetical protein C8J56DRAFT_931060 [Mycena floridula]|nr:hypothetical protein C8J56DRAFT_931060 [Mycena floridula]